MSEVMRGFVFSLDAFISFTLAIAAIYSLIFFSSIPSSYYYTLTQGHYLTHDALLSASTTPCRSAIPATLCANSAGSLLENLAFSPLVVNQRIIENSIGRMIPQQFGFVVEVGDGSGFRKIYDRAVDSPDESVRSALSSRPRRISVSSESVVFGFPTTPNRLLVSPYSYNTCGAGERGSRLVGSGTAVGSGGAGIGGSGESIITCGHSLNNYPGFSGSGISAGSGGGSEGLASGDGNPDGEYLVPKVESRVLRLIVYI